jgi:hypothetical protein
MLIKLVKVLDHFTYQKIISPQIIDFKSKGHLTETPFDRTTFGRMPFDRKFIRPNRRLTERRLTESSFYRKVMGPIFFRKWSFYRIYFRQKMSFNR